MQLSKDGAAAVNFEHSWGDGVAVLRYFQDIHKDSLENPQIHPNSTPDTSRIENVRKLGTLCVNTRINTKKRKIANFNSYGLF